MYLFHVMEEMAVLVKRDCRLLVLLYSLRDDNIRPRCHSSGDVDHRQIQWRLRITNMGV